MTALLASVQTADDASGGNLVIAAMVVAVLIVVVAVSVVEIRREWRRSSRVIDDMPLPPEPPTPRAERIPQPREESRTR